MDLGINNLGMYVAGTVLTIIVPGANTYRVLQGVKQHGFQGGVYASSGVMLADFIFMLAAAMGIGVVIHSNDWAYLLLLIIGGLYFLNLGISILRNWKISISNSINDLAHAAIDGSAGKAKSELRAIFKSSFLTCIVNFKAIFFYGLFLPTFIDTSFSPSWVPLLVLCLICAALLFVYYFLLSFLGLSLFGSRYGNQLFSGISLLFGIFIVGLALKILAESYSTFQKLSVAGI